MRRAWLLGIAAVLATGCGPSVKGICDDLVDECFEDVDEDECRDGGDRMEDQAEAFGCEDVFDAYLECVDVAICDWRDLCEDDRAAVDACIDPD